MAQIDFSAGYRNSTKGATLKALALRRAKAAEEQTAAMAPRQIASPWQGAAQIAETVGAGIREGRVAAEEQAGREQFAQLLSGGLTADEMGQAMILDPDIAMKYQENTWKTEADKRAEDARKAELLQAHGWDVDAATARVQAERESQERQFGQQTTIQEDTQAHQVETAKTLAANQAKAKEDEQAEARLAAQTEEIARADAATAAAQRDTEKAATLAGTQEEQTRLGAALGSDEAKLAEGLRQGTISQEAYDQGMASIAAKRKKELMTPGQTQMEQDYAKEYGEWTTQGRSQAVANATQLAKAAELLTRDQGLLAEWTGIGAPSGRVTGLLPEAWTKFINPEAISTRDAVRSVAQELLKAILGTQFAAVEGQQVLERAFDPGQQPKENLRRVQLLSAKLAQISAQREAKAQFYDQNGMIEGFQGPSSTRPRRTS